MGRRWGLYRLLGRLSKGFGFDLGNRWRLYILAFLDENEGWLAGWLGWFMNYILRPSYELVLTVSAEGMWSGCEQCV